MSSILSLLHVLIRRKPVNTPRATFYRTSEDLAVSSLLKDGWKSDLKRLKLTAYTFEDRSLCLIYVKSSQMLHQTNLILWNVWRWLKNAIAALFLIRLKRQHSKVRVSSILVIDKVSVTSVSNKTRARSILPTFQNESMQSDAGYKAYHHQNKRFLVVLTRQQRVEEVKL